jgi:hypothetical protein
MAQEISQDLNFTGGAKVVNLRIEILAAPPASPSDGQVYFNADGFLYKYNLATTSWKIVKGFTNLYEAAGLIGVGTATPSKDLTVQSNLPTVRLETAQSPTGYYAEITAQYDGAEPFFIKSGSQKLIGIKDLGLGNPSAYINGYYGTAIVSSNGSPVLADIRVFITTAGKVGVGFVSPVAMLDVNGDISATILKLTSLAGSFNSNRQIAVDTNGNFVASSATKIITYTANGTWVKPAGCSAVEIICIGAGGGGGSGGVQTNTTTAVSGGGGGGGGGYSTIKIPASSLTNATYTITVGTGGIGGNGVAVVGSGLAGTNGGNSSFSTLLHALGGSGGGAGSISVANGGAGGGGDSSGTQGGSCGVGAAGTKNDSAQTTKGATGGGAGGGLTAANATTAGAVGGGFVSHAVLLAGGAKGTIGNNSLVSQSGTGGGGTDSALAGTSAAGGNGGLYGAGGGGTGASRVASGKGGNGANGEVIVIEYY